MIANRSNFAERLREFPGIALADDAALARRGHWRAVFRRQIGAVFDDRIILEIGCADALFLARVAARHPKTAFVGLDWKYKAVYDGAARVDASGLRNVALLRGRAQDLARVFGEREIDEIWIFHPDPCAREVELKNRLIAEPFLRDAHAVLRDRASTISFKTDHPGYYQWVLALLGIPQPDWAATRARPRELMRDGDVPPRNEAILHRFEPSALSSNFWGDPAALEHASARMFAGEQTSFEAKFVAKRRPIYFVELRKRDGGH